MKQELVPNAEAELKRMVGGLRAISAYSILSQPVVIATMHPMPQVALALAGY